MLRAPVQHLRPWVRGQRSGAHARETYCVRARSRRCAGPRRALLPLCAMICAWRRACACDGPCGARRSGCAHCGGCLALRRQTLLTRRASPSRCRGARLRDGGRAHAALGRAVPASARGAAGRGCHIRSGTCGGCGAARPRRSDGAGTGLRCVPCPAAAARAFGGRRQGVGRPGAHAAHGVLCACAGPVLDRHSRCRRRGLPRGRAGPLARGRPRRCAPPARVCVPPCCTSLHIPFAARYDAC